MLCASRKSVPVHSRTNHRRWCSQGACYWARSGARRSQQAKYVVSAYHFRIQLRYILEKVVFGTFVIASGVGVSSSLHACLRLERGCCKLPPHIKDLSSSPGQCSLQAGGLLQLSAAMARPLWLNWDSQLFALPPFLWSSCMYIQSIKSMHHLSLVVIYHWRSVLSSFLFKQVEYENQGATG